MTEEKKKKLYAKLRALEKFLDDSHEIYDSDGALVGVQMWKSSDLAVKELIDVVEEILADVEVTK